MRETLGKPADPRKSAPSAHLTLPAVRGDTSGRMWYASNVHAGWWRSSLEERVLAA